MAKRVLFTAGTEIIPPGCVTFSETKAWNNPTQHGKDGMWEALPEALLRKIIHAGLSSGSRRDLYAFSGVCRSWHAAARETIFSGLWESPQVITHPAQLFALSPVPVRGGGLVKCCIQREDISKGFGPPQYKFNLYLWSSQRHRTGKFLLSAVQTSRHYKVMHLLKTDRNMPCAKLLSNILGSQYRVYARLSKLGGASFSSCPKSVGKMDLDGSRALGVIKYKLRMKGIMRPRRLAVWLPHCAGVRDANFSKKSFGWGLPKQDTKQTTHNVWNQVDRKQKTSSMDTSFTTSHKGKDTPWAFDPANKTATKLVNKLPHWNDCLQSWCLNFKGRVKLASVKNFQLMSRNDTTGRIVMQFGKVDKNLFIMDYNPTVISAVQAFGIALTSFDGGIRF